MPTKKKRDFKFFWEAPHGSELEMPSITKISLPEIRMEKTIPVHLMQTENEIIVRAEMSGFKKNDIDLNVTESYIEIVAAKKMERIERTDRAFLHEKQAGALRRAFALPAKVDPDRTEATLQKGVLVIVMSKLYPAEKKKRRIDVK